MNRSGRQRVLWNQVYYGRPVTANVVMTKANPPLWARFSMRTVFLITTVICIVLGTRFYSIRIVSGLLGWLYTALVILGALILVQYPLFLLFRKYLPTEEEDELEN